MSSSLSLGRLAIADPTPAEILIQRVKKLAPEEIAQGIKEFDPVVCTQVFLSELKRVIPTPEQVNQLISSVNRY